VLFFQRQSEAIDDGPKNLKKLSNAVETLRLVNELEEHVVDRSADVRPQVQKLAINTVQRGLQEITLAGIFRVKQFKQLG